MAERKIVSTGNNVPPVDLHGQPLVNAPSMQATTGQLQGPAVQIDDDFCGWLLDQASALRERRTLSLDWDHLAEELEAMAAKEKRELVERLATLFEHLLKLEYQPEKRREHSRKVTIIKA